MATFHAMAGSGSGFANGRRLPIGAELADGGVHVRVWAPIRRRVELVEDAPPRRAHALEREDGGYFSGFVAGLAAGDRYWFRLDGGERLLPDPASRFQPEGPHGPSQVVDPRAFHWTDGEWRGLTLRGQVVYELHPDTFTREGTWAAAAADLAWLAELGITAVEVLPVAEFPGRFGWGYDGVDLFAPSHLYGAPDDLRAFVDRAHAVGVGVLLDVVYNHLGPDGNYLKEFAPAYFDPSRATDWGEPPNFDRESSGPVRELFIANSGYWIEEYHLDGLRLDATQSIFDTSPLHVLHEMEERVRRAAGGRGTLVIAENEPQDSRWLRPSAHGTSIDALWNDDFHHSAVAALTGRTEAYYSDTRGTPQELISCAKRGFLFQGQHYAWQGKPRGSPTRGLAGERFIAYLQNHDQVANSAYGWRLDRLTSPGRLRAMTALLLLGPWTPMLFQGQEMNASAPFLYFADHAPVMAAEVRSGRVAFLRQFPSIASPAVRDRLDDPGDVATFERCKLDRAERERHAEAVALHRDLLHLRRADSTLALQGEAGLDGAVLGPEAFCLRFFAGEAALDRLLLVNLGCQLDLASVPEPLVAPPEGGAWRVAWSSEEPRYGGLGTPSILEVGILRLPGHSAVLLAATGSGGDGGSDGGTTT